MVNSTALANSWRTLALSCFFFGGLFARADVSLPAIFGDNMVLQQNADLPIWGKASPDESVEVTFAGHSAKTTAGADGKWLVKLPAQKGDGTPGTLMVSGKNKLSFSNVVVGDVWLCSGQSNMERSVSDQTDKDVLTAKADVPILRLFLVKTNPCVEPQGEVSGKWVVCSRSSVLGFSVVAFLFGLDLQETFHRPIGLIGSYRGGTPIQAWISLSGFRAPPQLSKYVDYQQKRLGALPQAREKYRQQLDNYAKAVQNIPEGQKSPDVPSDPEKYQRAPSVLFNGMIAPLIPYAIKGVIWYQGEANAKSGELALEYSGLLPRLIADWRSQWGQGAFPFLIVQLANFGPPASTPVEGFFAWVRDAQRKALAVPGTGLAVAIDLGDAKTIHPQRKAEVARRLALVAKSVAYEQHIEFSGPLYRDMTVEGGRLRLHFSHVGDGLTVMPIDLSAKSPLPLPDVQSSELSGFAIAGRDKNWQWAKAHIDGDSVVVSSEKIAEPVAVRYGWADNPPVNLGNKNGLPAVPFRTDDWKDVPVVSVENAKPGE